MGSVETRRGLYGLPPELVAEILDYLPRERIIQLTTTSRTFNACCSRVVYKTIDLEGLESVRKCCETLAFNFRLASYVRTLKLTVSPDEAPKSAFTAQLNRLLHSAFKNVSQSLMALQLNLPKDNVVTAIKRLSFPHLKAFNVASALNPDLAQFLLAHPHLEELRITGVMALPTKPRGSRGAHKTMRIPMTSMKEFAGPPGACAILVPGSQIHDVLLHSSGYQSGPDWEREFVEALLESKQPIKVLGFSKFMYRRALFDTIGQKLSNISKLSLGLSEPDQVHTVLDGLLSVLPELRNLYYLRLSPPVSVDLQGIDEDILNTDHLFIRKITSCQEAVSVCELISSVTWARLSGSGQWLPLFPTAGGLHWWMQRMPLTRHIQRRVVSYITSVGHDDDEDEDEEFYEGNVHKLATAVGFMLNRAFGLEEDPDHDHHYEYDPDTEEEYERLRVPVRDHEGKQLEPYVDDCKMRWDTFASIIGFTTLHPIPVFLDNMALFNLFLPPVQSTIPVLDEKQRELMKVVLDLLYNSFNTKKGILFRNYFRNPDEHWGDRRMGLGIALPFGVVPLGCLTFD